MTGLILGAVLVAVMIIVGGRVAYRRFWLPRRADTHKCPHCGKSYRDAPYYCPHCGEVVDYRSQRR